MGIFTQAQYDALLEAYSLGAKTVEYADKKVEYRSLDDMAKLLEQMAIDLGLSQSPKKVIYPVYNKGIYPDEKCR